MHQLQLLAWFLMARGEALLRLGLCPRATRPIDGFEFAALMRKIPPQ